MDPTQQDPQDRELNPYAAPSSSRTDVTAANSRPYDPGKARLAGLSWKIPLLGLGLSALLNSVAPPPLGMVGGLIFMGSVVVGLLVSLIGIGLSFKYTRVLTPAICGLILNLLLILGIAAMFHAIALARDAARRASQREIQSQIQSQWQQQNNFSAATESETD